ncbi:MAG: hypothetical protein OXP10_07915 [Chloroflexota bacterium]|nr:hypothetical protein [Chloroflexota bacterium]
MDLYFERGEMDSPKGHALVFFRRKFDPNTVLATYIIALPIKVDVTRYIPPMFAGKMQDMLTNDLAGFAFPPLPEKIDDLDHIRRMAEAREDDLIDGGSVDDSDPMELIQVVSEVQQEYSRRWERLMEAQTPLPASSVNELIYELMGERDKLSDGRQTAVRRGGYRSPHGSRDRGGGRHAGPLSAGALSHPAAGAGNGDADAGSLRIGPALPGALLQATRGGLPQAAGSGTGDSASRRRNGVLSGNVSAHRSTLREA